MRHEIIEIPTEKSVGKLYTYILDNSTEIDERRTRPSIIICPGGGYEFTSDREAEPVAVRMNAMGFNAFVLRYSVYPVGFPTSLFELAMAVALIRRKHVEWHVDSKKVIVAGFSAGGHLAASLGVFWNRKSLFKDLGISSDEIRPDGLVLSYPVITSGMYAHQDSFVALLGENYDSLLDGVSLENQVSMSTPPTFLWHTYTDEIVPCENSFLFASALRRSGVPLEMHIYPKGGHGLSLGTEETTARDVEPSMQPDLTNWIEMAGRWIKGL